MTRFPYVTNRSVRDAEQLRAKTYAQDFNAKRRACIQRSKAVYDRDGENNDNYFIFCGDEIFTLTEDVGGFPSNGSRCQRLARAWTHKSVAKVH